MKQLRALVEWNYFSTNKIFFKKSETLNPFESNNGSRLDTASTLKEILNGFGYQSINYGQINLSIPITSKNENKGGRNFQILVICGCKFESKYMDIKLFESWLAYSWEYDIWYVQLSTGFFHNTMC